MLPTCGSSADWFFFVFFVALGVFYVVRVEESQVTFPREAAQYTVDGHLKE